jgi:PAS domain S-box-containing protein
MSNESATDLNVTDPNLGAPQRFWIGVLRDRGLLISLLLLVATFFLLWYLFRQSSALYNEMAIQGTELQAKAIEEFRQIYTSEVVDRLRNHGVEVTHDYANRKKVVPLPATLTIEIGKRFERDWPGAHVRLISEHPFPARKDRVLDEFEREALRELSANPGKPFFRFEDYERRHSLRYAVADILESHCVECHYNHPDSPKRDWKVGDVRGVLEVIRPLDHNIARAHSRLQWTMYLVVSSYAVGVVGLGLVARRLRRLTRKLRHAEVRTRAVVDHAADGILSFDGQLQIESANGAAGRMFALGPADLKGRPFDSLLTAPSSAPVRDYVGECRSNASASDSTTSGASPTLTCEVEGSRPNGKPFPMTLSVSPIRIGDRPLFTEILHDLTQRKRTEAALEQERFLMRMLMQNLPHAIYFKDRECRFLRINEALSQKFGLPDPQLAVGKTDADFFSAEHAQQSRRDEEELMRTGEPMLSYEEKNVAGRA